jgi:CRP-like cAMP-binding protein
LQFFELQNFSERRKLMVEFTKLAFDLEAFLTSSGLGRKIVKVVATQKFFSQGESANAVFYLQSGSAKLTVVAANGKEATITLLHAGDFVGEESLASVGALHMATATAITDCIALKIERGEMMRVMHEEHPLAAVFIQFLLTRGMRIQSDLVDQLFNSSEKRLARTLLLMAEICETGEAESLIPDVSEETLAEIIGSTTPMVSFFMNRFCDLGLIDYDGRIRVHRALLNVILHDDFPDDNAVKTPIFDPPRHPSNSDDRTRFIN